MPASVEYRLRVHDARAHLYEVICTLAATAGAQVFSLPAWIRGSYLVRDFAKHVVDLQAWRGGHPCPIRRLDKSRFAVDGEAAPLQLRYRVHAFDESVRKAWLDTRRGFFNGSSLFYCPQGFERAGFALQIAPPEDQICADWRVATTLAAVAVDARGFGRYAAADYESLIDHPVEMGAFLRQDFDVDGVPHALVLSGRAETDPERVAADLARICHEQRTFFGQQPAMPLYLFLTHVVAGGYGGLEHRDCTALICSRGDLPPPRQSGISREYRQFLGLCSHEYFHLWNVKRITPGAFLESDLAAEAYSRDLWHYEGVTSYYDDLFLLRAGLIDAPSYLDLLAEQATRLERSPARQVHTLADASFETWIKYYQPDENAPNASTNYYVKGALTALCLDLTLRLHSKCSLDAVMRALWEGYGARGVGVPEGGLEALAQEISGMDLRSFFDHCLRSTEELPLAELLAAFGVRAGRRPAAHALDMGGRSSARPPTAWAGLKLRAGEAVVAQVLNGSPAERAGLSAGDQLIALDGLKLGHNSWQRRLDGLTPGRALDLHYFRGDELMSTRIVLDPPPEDTWTLELDDATAEAVGRRQRWLKH